MRNRWLFKTEPSDYSYDRLRREGSTTWDGVGNPLALRHLRQVRRGDSILVYHTGSEKAVVGVARATSDSYPDQNDRSGKRVVVDLRPEQDLPRPVSLAELKARNDMADFDLVRLGRLSVMPVSGKRWETILGVARRNPPVDVPSSPVRKSRGPRAASPATRRRRPRAAARGR